MNRFFALLILSLISCYLPAQTSSDRSNYKLLWRISGNGLNAPSYLFGTMHVQDNKAFAFSDSVLLKISACEAFALEVHPDSVVRAMFTFPFDQTNNRENKFKKILSPKDYEELDSLMKLHTGYSLEKLKSPSMAKMLLEKKAGKKDKKTFLDAYLYNLARRQGKIILGLENAAEQLNLTDNLQLGTSAEIKEILSNRALSDSINSASYSSLLDLYYKGDIDAMRNFLKKGPADYYNALITKRNLGMSTAIKQEIHSHSTFIAVGAGHLPGEEGLIQLLRNAGYTVTLVKPTFTGLAKKYTYEEQNEKWFTFHSETGGYAVELPQAPSSYRIDSLGLAFQIYVDIGTPIMYQCTHIPLNNRYQGQSSNFILDALEKNIKSKSNREIEKSSKIKIAGLEGREFYVQSGGGFFKTRIIHRGDIIYLLQVGLTKEAANSADATKFLSSFQTKELRQQTWKDFTDNRGAYFLRMPGKIETQLVKSNNAEGMYELNIIHATDFATQETFLARYNDFPPGYISNNDSIYYSSVIENILARMKGTNLQVKEITTNGFTGREFTFEMSKEAVVRGRTILRGNRVYLLLTTSPTHTTSTGVHDFINSFQFIPYQSSELKEFNLPEGIKIKLPIDFIPDSVHTEKDLQSERRIYNVVDKNTGILYMITTSHFSPYDQYPEKDAFFKKRNTTYLDEEDTILTTKDISNARFIGQDILVSSNIANAHKRTQTIACGRQLFEFTAFLPADHAQSNFSSVFFNSIELTTPSKPWSLFSDKTAAILTDITSTDSLIQQKAEDAIRSHDFSVAALPQIYQALSKTYPDDHLEYQSVRMELLNVLDKTHDHTTLPFVRGFYATLADTAVQKSGVLSVLGALKTKEATLVLRDLLKKEEKKTDFSSYQALQSYRDSLQLLNYVLPDLITNASKFNYTWLIFNITKTALDSGALTADVKKSVIEALLQAGNANVSTPVDKNSEQYYQWAQTGENVASVLGSIPFTTEVKDLLVKFSASDETGTKLIASIELLKNNDKVDPAALKKIAHDPRYRISLYEQLKEINKEKLFPTQYKTQEKFAESALYQYMEDEEGAPDKTELLETRIIKYQGEKQKVYIYKYRYDSDEAEEWYLALSGPYSLSKEELISSEDLTYNSYEPYDKTKKMHDVLKTLLEGFDVELTK